MDWLLITIGLTNLLVGLYLVRDSRKKPAKVLDFPKGPKAIVTGSGTWGITEKGREAVYNDDATLFDKEN